MLPQYGKKNHDPKIHHAPLPMPSLQIVNFVLIIILFILVLWLGSRHYHVTQQAVKHHLGKLQLKSDQTPGSDLHVYELAIREDTVGQFGRYPKQGAIQEMQFQNISRYLYRLIRRRTTISCFCHFYAGNLRRKDWTCKSITFCGCAK